MKNILVNIQTMSMCAMAVSLFSCQQLDSSDASQSPPQSQDKPQVAFLSSQSGNLEVYLKDLNTNELTQITSNTLDDLNPVWSNNGEYLAFVGRTLKTTYLNVYNTSTKQTTTLVNDSYKPSWINWSPLKNELVFVGKEQNDSNLYTVNLEGSINLIFNSGTGSLVSPKYSNNGSTIAVIENDNLSLFKNGTVINEVLPKKFRILDFDWGSGNNTLYVTARVNREVNIHEVNIDTLETRILIEGPHLDVEARYFPPNKIAFLSSRIDGGTRQLYLYNTDSQEIKQLTRDNIEVLHPSWSPTGEHITYVTNVGQQFTSMILDTESGEATPISLEEKGFHLLPTIRPMQ